MLASDFCGQAQNSCFARERKLDIVAQDPWDGGCGISRVITTSSQPASQALTQNAQPPKGVDSGFGEA